MARYPVTSIDYARSKRLLETAEDLFARSKQALEELKALKKECSKIDSVSEGFDTDFDELLDGEHEYIGVAVGDELELQFEPLATANERYGQALKQLRPIVEQTEAWDKHFRKQWQGLFLEKFGETITKAQADESFLEAIELAAADDVEWEGLIGSSHIVKRTPGAPVEWVDTGGTLKIDLEKLFEQQQLFDPSDYESEEEEDSEEES